MAEMSLAVLTTWPLPRPTRKIITSYSLATARRGWRAAVSLPGPQ